MSAADLAAGRLAARTHPSRRALAAFAVLLVVILVAAAAAWRFGPWTSSGVTEYAVPVEGGIPTSVAAAPDGSIWLAIESANQVGLFRDGRLRLLDKGQQNVEPLGLAADAAGNAWYTDAPIRSISRISQDGVVASFELTTPIATLARLAVAPDGAVWFADGTTNSLTRLKDGVFTPHEIPSFRAGPFGVAVGPDGTVWGTLQYANRLARVAPSGEISELDLPSRGGVPTDVVVDRAGAVWFGELRANKIGRYADGRFSEFDVPTPASGVTALALAPDGAIWFAETRGHKLGRLRDGRISEFRLPREDARPFGIAVDRDGNVWYADLAGKLGVLPAQRARGG